MKSILSPTDFSKASQATLPYLRAFRQRMNAEITFLHAYELRKTASMLVSMDQIMKEDAIRRMENWKNLFAEGLDSEEGIHSRIQKGTLLHSVTGMIESGNYDLAAFGITGVSSFLEAMEGSYTNRVLKQTSIPILAIPEEFTYQPFETIVLAVDDLKFESPEMIRPFIEIAKAWNSKVWVYHKDTGDHSAPVLEKELEGLPSVSYYHEPEDGDSILESILGFSKDKKASLLCMVRHKQTFIERAFNQSVTSKGLFKALLPMLILSE